MDDVNAKELMKNKSTNAINSLAGKVAGVTITQTSGAAGAGSQIILRGGTSLERDNQPLFVVDGVIYDNSTSIIGNSASDRYISPGAKGAAALQTDKQPQVRAASGDFVLSSDASIIHIWTSIW